MTKIRVYELAKEIGMESKELINRFGTMGVSLKNHMSAIDNEDAQKMREKLMPPKERAKLMQERGEKETPSKPPEKPPASQPVNRTADREQPRPQGQQNGQNQGQGQQPRPAGQNQGQGYQQRPAGQNQGQGYQPRPAGQNQGQGYQQRPAGQNQGQGYQQRPAGQNQGQGYQQRPAGQNQGQGYQQRPAGQSQGQGYQQRPAGQNQGQGYQQRPAGQNQGQGYQQRPAGQNQGQGYQQRPAGQNQGQGYQQRPAGQNQGQGYQQRPAGQNQGQGYQQRPAGQNQGQGYQQRPAGQNQGQGYQQRPAGQNQGQGYQQRPSGPNQGPARPNAPGAGAKPGFRGNQQPGKPKTAARPFSLAKPVRKPKHKKPKHAKPDVDSPVILNPGDVEIQVITIGGSIAVQDLAEKMQKNSSELIKKLMGLGVMATINQEIDSDTAAVLAAEFNFEIQIEAPEVEEIVFEEPEDKPEDLLPRPCVVTVMGHVDHGKTSLLDVIREANVIASEAGGITQHIGAYQVDHNGKKITFLDTPGHEAFTAMRARGAQATDIAILVVAADDGVMPQTVEAINHSKAAGVPIIVAINKMDKPGANPDRVKQELTEYNMLAEDWGGETICVPVSAKSRMGIESLLEMILLVAEMGELKANPNRLAKGTVIEAELDKGRGPVATVLVQTGTLNIGDAIVAGMAFGKVRAMVDDKGRRVKKALPSTPVEVLGLSDVPQAGDIFMAAPDEKTARLIATKRVNKKREEEQKAKGKISLEDLFIQIKEGQVKELNIIIKADVQGSIEALRQSLAKLSTAEVRVNAIHGGVGAITETDIMLASASNAIIIGFNVRPDVNARKAAENEKVDVRLYRVIYNAIEDVKAAMSGLLEPEFKEVILGRVEVRQIFKATKYGTIAGCYVLEGKITRNAELRVIRDGIVVHEGKLDSLKRFKDDAKDVAQGYECGVTIDNFNDIQEGDIIEPFIFEEIKRQL